MTEESSQPDRPQDRVSLHKDGSSDAGEAAEPRPGVDFDPYRFGLPDHPIPPEFAPPGYIPPRQHQMPGPPQFGPLPPMPPPPHLGYPGGPPRGVGSGHGKAVASLVLGIASIVLCWLTVLDAIPIVIAVVLGTVAIREARFKPNREGRSMAIAGICCALVGAVLAAVLSVVIYTRFKDCLQLSPGSSEYSNCISNHM